jgi:hypothetical protein
MLRLLPTTASCTNLVQKNQCPKLNWHILTFLTINFTVWSLILSTGGDALSYQLTTHDLLPPNTFRYLVAIYFPL